MIQPNQQSLNQASVDAFLDDDVFKAMTDSVNEGYSVIAGKKAMIADKEIASIQVGSKIPDFDISEIKAIKATDALGPYVLVIDTATDKVIENVVYADIDNGVCHVMRVKNGRLLLDPMGEPVIDVVKGPIHLRKGQ